jgi:GR25 family glycosyltransferase involved in LPS biosynthesis
MYYLQPKKEGIDKEWHEYVDVIYYINLDERTDRKSEFLDEMSRMGVPSEKIVRISAISKPGKGDWGCSLSHVNTIGGFLDTSYNNCIVFEDDYMFTESLQTMNEMFANVFDNVNKYDIIMLSASEIEVKDSSYKYLKKVLNAQTTSGYMVNRDYAQTLYLNYQEGAKLIEKSYEKGKSDTLQGPYCVDQYWKILQPESDWFMFYPKLGIQRESYSDIQDGITNYGV